MVGRTESTAGDHVIVGGTEAFSDFNFGSNFYAVQLFPYNSSQAIGWSGIKFDASKSWTGVKVISVNIYV